MSKCLRLASIFLLSITVGCSSASKPSKPDEITTIKSPIDGVFYTVENSYGQSAIDSDFTRVFAHLERNGKSVKVLVLSGAYLKVSKIVWDNQHENTICLGGGFTETFHNEITLIAGGASETIHSHLQENCSDLEPHK